MTYEYYVYVKLLLIDFNEDEDMVNWNLQIKVVRARHAVERSRLLSKILKHECVIVLSERSREPAAANKLIFTLLIDHIYTEQHEALRLFHLILS